VRYVYFQNAPPDTLECRKAAGLDAVDAVRLQRLAGRGYSSDKLGRQQKGSPRLAARAARPLAIIE